MDITGSYACSISNCNIKEDFLPFQCKKCNQYYCQEHRNNHECNNNKEIEEKDILTPKEINNINNTISGSVKSIFESVEKRFDNNVCIYFLSYLSISI
jgi:hypothetical protein